MAENGVRTTDFTNVTQIDDVIGNYSGTTVRFSIGGLITLIGSRIGPSYQTRALLYADLDWPAGAIGAVYGDATESLIGVYKKSGASGAGSWARIGDLPVSQATVAMLALKADKTALAAETDLRIAGDDDSRDLIGALSQGFRQPLTWDPASGTFPAAALAGSLYRATGTGTVDGVSFVLGNTLVASVDAPSTTTYAGNWIKGDYAELLAAMTLRPFKTIAAMTVSSSLMIGQRAQVAGRGEFEIVAAATYTAGPTVIDLTGIAGQAVSTSRDMDCTIDEDTRPIAFLQSVFGTSGPVTFSYRGKEFGVDLSQLAEFDVVSGGGVQMLASAYNTAINRNEWVLDAEKFGVKATGDDAHATANATILNKMANILRDAGQKGEIIMPPGGDVRTNLPLNFADGLIYNGNGCQLYNIRTAQISGGDMSCACFSLGSFARQDTDDFTFIKATAAIEQGASEVFVDTSNFMDGDIVLLVDAAIDLGTSNAALPNRLHVTKVTKTVTGKLSFSDPITFSAAAGSGVLGVGAVNGTAQGCWVANVGSRVNRALTGGIVSFRHFVDGPSLFNGRFRNKFSSVFQRSGAYEMLMENCHVVDNPYGILANGLVKSRIVGLKASFYTRAIEVKVGSRDTTLEDCILTYNPNVFDTAQAPEPAVTWGENIENVRLLDSVVDFGKSAVATPVAFNSSFDCGIARTVFRGRPPSVTTTVIASVDSVRGYFRDNVVDLGPVNGYHTSLGGNQFDVSRNVFAGLGALGALQIPGGAIGGKFAGNRIPAQGRVFVSAGVTAFPVVEDNQGITGFEGDRTTISASRNRGDEWNKTNSVQDAEGLSADGVEVTSTSQVIIGDVITIPAATFDQNDTFSFMISGTKNAGLATLAFNVAIDTDSDGVALDPDDDPNIAFTASIDTACQNFAIEVKVMVISATQIVTDFRIFDLTNGTVKGDVARFTSVDFLNKTTRFELSGSVASGVTMQVRIIDRDRDRFGMVG